MRVASNVLWVWLPLVAGYLNCDQAREGLLLARSIDCRELGSNRNDGRWYRVTRDTLRASRRRFHRLDIVVVPPLRAVRVPVLALVPVRRSVPAVTTVAAL